MFTMALCMCSDSDLDMLTQKSNSIREQYIEFVEQVSPYIKAGDKYTVNRRINMVKDFIKRLIDDYKNTV